MLETRTETGLAASMVIERADRFFGSEGWGVMPLERSERAIHFVEGRALSPETVSGPRAEDRSQTGRGVGRAKVVVVGCGFAGAQAVKEMGQGDVDVLVLDRHNYNTFRPLLYQVAAAGVQPEAIAFPVRKLVRKYRNVDFRLAEVEGVDPERREVMTSEGRIGYDYLLLAAGSRPNFFGLEEVERVAHSVYDINDAIALRNHVLACLEKAQSSEDQERRQALMTFVIVGAGPTGVELAGALAELGRNVLQRDYSRLDLKEMRIILLEMLDTVLPPFPTELGAYANKHLEEKGVQVRLGTAVDGADCDLVSLSNGEQIPAQTIIWTAGVRPRLTDKLSFEMGQKGRIRVTDTLQIADYPEILIAGDMAFVTKRDGEALPQLATVAMQEGRAAARNILRMVENRSPEPFGFRERGIMASIGRSTAVARVFGRRFTGLPAWLVWLFVHIYFLMGMHNRMLVLLDWAYNYLRYDPGARVLVGTRRECDTGLQEFGQEAEMVRERLAR